MSIHYIAPHHGQAAQPRSPSHPAPFHHAAPPRHPQTNV